MSLLRVVSGNPRLPGCGRGPRRPNARVVRGRTGDRARSALPAANGARRRRWHLRTRRRRTTRKLALRVHRRRALSPAIPGTASLNSWPLFPGCPVYLVVASLVETARGAGSSAWLSRTLRCGGVAWTATAARTGGHHADTNRQDRVERNAPGRFRASRDDQLRGWHVRRVVSQASGRRGGGTRSPEELIAAAHSACYAMSLSNEVGQAGGTPRTLDVKADVSLGPDPAGGFRLTGITLTVSGEVDGLDAAGFERRQRRRRWDVRSARR